MLQCQTHIWFRSLALLMATPALLQADFNGFIYQNIYPLGSKHAPVDLVVADFNNDAILDIAVVSNDTDAEIAYLQLFLGNGDGTFTAGFTQSIPQFAASSLTAGQFTLDDDNNLSIAVAGYSIDDADGAIITFLGDNNGNFSAQPTQLLTDSQSINGIVANFFDTSHPNEIFTDLAVTASSGDVYILHGDGEGNFTCTIPDDVYAVGSMPVGIASGVFTSSDNVDLVVANSTDGTISILFGNGDGTFQDADTIGVPSYPVNVVAADFNSDGFLDIAVGGHNANICPGGAFIGNSTSVLLGDGDGSFQLLPSIYIGGSSNEPGLAAGDFSNNDVTDLAILTGNNLEILLGNNNGTFNFTDFIYTTGSGPVAIGTGDFNSDGYIDFAVVNQGSQSLTILLQNITAPALHGKTVVQKFASQTEYSNVISWNPSSASDTVGYYLYRNGKLIATIPAKGPLLYTDTNRKPGVPYLYELYSFNSDNLTSAPSSLILTP